MRIFPMVSAVVVLALFGLGVPAAADDAPQAIDIVAKRFEFTPKEVHVKKGLPVVFRLTTQDVAHGFSSRKLKLDADIVPGKTAEVSFTPDTAGTYTVVCDHFCGSGHGGMKMKIVVDE